MGGKGGGGGTSTTQVVIPPWIEGILKPLLGGSASKLQQLQNQGYNVLQGSPPGEAMSLDELNSQTQSSMYANPGGRDPNPQDTKHMGTGGGGVL
jgi:hypothetical protein